MDKRQSAGFIELLIIIALYPYNRPGFPAPETWLEGFLSGAQRQIVEHDCDMPIWVKEIGAPHQGNSAGKFFGYPKKAEISSRFESSGDGSLSN
jgi:hypothetical protein